MASSWGCCGPLCLFLFLFLWFLGIYPTRNSGGACSIAVGIQRCRI
uniref:Uncharacterized protein n=1 Tax=Arundo donax TaxID=35708 RepID=A0A0A9EGL1_ARUDO